MSSTQDKYFDSQDDSNFINFEYLIILNMSITISPIRVKGSDKRLLTLYKIPYINAITVSMSDLMNPLFSKLPKCISQLSNYIM